VTVALGLELNLALMTLGAAVVLALAWVGLSLLERTWQKHLEPKKRSPWHL
jgi:hypothetical protein